jgi:hypothetical protein
MRRRPSLFTVAAVPILFGLVGNVATGLVDLPAAWTPGIWAATAVLLAVTIGVEASRVRREDAGEGLPLDTAADQLAQSVLTQWRREEERRRIHDPYPLPVRWTVGPVDAMDMWTNIRRAGPGADAGPLPLAGDLTVVDEVYERIPTGRLVVLGPAGSGKTILMLRFVLQRLSREPAHGGPVPVIFGLSTWDPTRTSLRDWLTAQLTRDHPGLSRASTDGRQLAGALVDAGRILPVLDGLDEMAAGLRPAAVAALNATSAPFLLTSRVEEYRDVVTAAGVLRGAACVEVAAVALDDVSTYLCRSAVRPGASEWEPVLDALRRDPGHPLAAVLANPLMIGLARTIYNGPGAPPPAELLAFREPDEIDDHLLASFVPAVLNRPPADRNAPGVHRWNPAKAERWLSELAVHMNRLGTRDLAWWQLVPAAPAVLRIVVFGVLLGLAYGAGTVVAYLPIAQLDGDDPATYWGRSLAVAAALVLGVVVGLSANGPAPAGTRLSVRFRPRSALVGVGIGAVIGAVMGLPTLTFGLDPLFSLWYMTTFMLALGFLLGFGQPFTGSDGRPLRPLGQTRRLLGSLVRAVPLGLAVGGVALLAPDISMLGGLPALGGWVPLPGGGFNDPLTDGLIIGVSAALAVGIGGVLQAPVDIRTVLSPVSLLRADRTSMILQTGVLMLVFSVACAIPVVVYGVVLGDAELLLLSPLIGPWIGVPVGVTVGFVGSAWIRWVATGRIILPLMGQLPWRVITFLEDAARLGVLRQAGPVYQFRHARLQDRLAARLRPSVR